MPRSYKRKKRPTYRKTKRRQVDFQKWFLNLAIFSIAVVIVGFIFSMGRRFNAPGEKVTLSQVNVIPPDERPTSALTVIEVLNGSGVSGLGQKFTNYLRQNGYDVIATGNADRSNYEHTHLIARTEGSAKIRDVNTTMMLEADKLYQDMDSTLHVDLTLIIGRDYQHLPVYQKILDIGESY